MPQDKCIWCGGIYQNYTEVKGVCPTCANEVKEKFKEESILTEAHKLVNGDRQAEYGDPIANWTETAEIATAITGRILSPADCCLVLIATKMARLRHQYKRDSAVDLVGYVEIYSRIMESR